MITHIYRGNDTARAEQARVRTPQASLYNVPTDVLFAIMTSYLNAKETAKLLLTCHHFQRITSTRPVWQNFYKNKYLYWKTDRFHPLLPQDPQTQEVGYRKLYGLRIEEPQKLWNVKATIKPHNPGWMGNVCTVVLSNGNLAIAARNQVTIWSPLGVQISTPYSVEGIQNLKLTALPDGMVAAASTCHCPLVRILSATGTLLHTLTGHTKPVTCSAVFKDGTGNIVTGSQDHTVRIWSRNGLLLRTYFHSESLTSVTILPNGGVIAVSQSFYFYPSTVTLWSPEGKKTKDFSETNSYAIAKIMQLPNGMFLTAANKVHPYPWSHTRVSLWSPMGERIKILKEYVSNKVLIEVLSGGIMAATASNKVYLWSSTGQLLNTLIHPPFTEINSIKALPKEGLITASDDNKIRIWSLDGNVVETLDGLKKETLSLEVFPNGIITTTNDLKVRIWVRDLDLMIQTSGARRRSCVVS